MFHVTNVSVQNFCPKNSSSGLTVMIDPLEDL